MHLVGLLAETVSHPDQCRLEVREVIQKYVDLWDKSVKLAHYQALAYLEDGEDCTIP